MRFSLTALKRGNNVQWDVVTAARGGSALYLLPGDGRGGLDQAQRIDLPGKVTTLVTGEINRRDGLVDIVVGIVAPEGPMALVYESPEGALKGQPEPIGLPAEALALVLGQLDEDYPVDLAVAAGSELMIVHGRDRKLSLDAASQTSVPRASISHISFSFAITSIAVGDFTGNNRTEIALLSADGMVRLVKDKITPSAREKVLAGHSESLSAGSWPQATRLVCARVSGLPRNELLVVDPANRQLHILLAAPAGDVGNAATTQVRHMQVSLDVTGELVAALPMRLNEDALSDLVILKEGGHSLAVAMTAPLATFTVNETGSANDANPNDGVCDTDLVAPGDQCTLTAAIQQANASPGADAIHFNIPGGGVPTITGPLAGVFESVTIDGTTQPAGRVELSGTSAGAIVPAALNINGGNSVVRGLVINSFGSRNGINLEAGDSNLIEGNYLGTDVNGSTALGGFTGVIIEPDSNNNTIGGTTPTARNVISGNSYGVWITGGTSGSGGMGNQVRGNFIGTNAAGTAALGNQNDGVLIINASNNTIGGVAAGSRNIISANGGNGVSLLGTVQPMGNLVQGNFIGADVNGTAALGNSGGSTGNAGVFIQQGLNNTIGGTTSGARNVISGNFRDAVIAFMGNFVQGNFIGTQADGVSPLGNASHGLTGGNNTTIGGVTPGAGNIIAFNGGDGIFISTGTGSAILHNSIFSNTGLGIDLDPDGVTANDACDGDAGANNLQNYPVLSSATATGSSVLIQGTLNSIANTTFTIEFFTNAACDPSGNGEGQTFIGSTTVTTDSSCVATVNVTLPTSVPAGQFITATATDPSNNTSEFSQCVQVQTACFYSISPTSQSFPAGGGTGSVNVTTGTGCAWTATSNASWITITSGASGTGNGAVNYSVAANNGPSRTGTMTIAGSTFTVNQASNCTFTITPTDAGFGRNGGTGGVRVTAGTGCAWTATSNASWITITSGTSGAGNGAVRYSVAANSGPARMGTMTIAGSTFTVNQAAGCRFTINPTNARFGQVGGTGSVTVTASSSSCSWSAVSNDNWITITAGSSGSGNGSVSYAVAPNNGRRRVGTLTIAGNTFAVVQTR